MLTFDRLDDAQRRAVRMALSGQDQEPVHVTTDPMPDQPHDHPAPTADRQVSAEDVLNELLTIDPRAVELAVARVAHKQAETELAALRRLVNDQEGTENG